MTVLDLREATPVPSEPHRLDAGIDVLRILATADAPAAVLGAAHAGAARRLDAAIGERPGALELEPVVAAWRSGARWGALRPPGRPLDRPAEAVPCDRGPSPWLVSAPELLATGLAAVDQVVVDARLPDGTLATLTIDVVAAGLDHRRRRALAGSRPAAGHAAIDSEVVRLDRAPAVLLGPVGLDADAPGGLDRHDLALLTAVVAGLVDGAAASFDHRHLVTARPSDASRSAWVRAERERATIQAHLETAQRHAAGTAAVGLAHTWQAFGAAVDAAERALRAYLEAGGNGALVPDAAVVARQSELRAIARLGPVRHVVDPVVYALLAEPARVGR